MSALFRWPKRPARKVPNLGDTRIVCKFLLWPHCLDDEWRWLGRERITQQCVRRWSHDPEGLSSFQYNGWIDRHWAKGAA